MEKEYTRKIIVISIALALVFGASLFFIARIDTTGSPITYTANHQEVEVNKKAHSHAYTLDYMRALANECGTEHPPQYLETLIRKFEAEPRFVYEFKYKGESQESDTYRVVVIRNVANYQTLEEFKKDFDLCAAGGEEYPVKMTKNWLMFENSCGSGFDDGSGRPNGCQIVKDQVGSTIELY
ncbi:hypothetical protein GF391_01020 [Candidatus Uhrbacteria bacterium]|nr:hypothetical protein [Candidatus Uhrbacteria bacterium]